MEPDKTEQIDRIIADLDRHIATMLACGHADSALLLKMAKLDLQTKRGDVSADDLRRLSAALDGGSGSDLLQPSTERGPQRGGRRFIELPNRSVRTRSAGRRVRKSPA